MLMNSLCAAALGFVLEIVFGDSGAVLYPLNLIRKYVRFLERKLTMAYDDTADAQRVAGGMCTFLVISAVVVISAALLLITYSISNVLGIICEAIMCWSAVSIRAPRDAATGIMRSLKNGQVVSAQKKLREISSVDVDGLEADDILRCTLAAVSDNISRLTVAPLFWTAVFGGMGGLVCRSIVILNDEVGNRTYKYKYFGKTPSKTEEIVNFVPSRLASVLCFLDAAFLGLDYKNALKVYERDRKSFPGGNSVQVQSMCAGALGVTLGGDEYHQRQLVRKEIIGNDIKPAEPFDIYWLNQFLTGCAVNVLVISAVLRTVLHIL